MMSRVMLDMFCGAGLASWGYWRSGRFSQVVGVDLNCEVGRSYAFDFVCADALSLDYEFLSQFEFIHASPPCQYYSKITPRSVRAAHPRLIPAVHRMLYASGVPYIIENVEGSGFDLRPNVVLNGYTFGLPSHRVRYFHVSSFSGSLRLIAPGSGVSVHDGNRSSVVAALGLDMISPVRLSSIPVHLMLQGFPPAMARFLAGLVFPHKLLTSDEKLPRFSCEDLEGVSYENLEGVSPFEGCGRDS